MHLSPDSNLAKHTPEIPTHNTQPLLHEIRHALQRLIDTGKTTIIDLRSIPLTNTEEEHLEILLGQGEVNCQLTALGRSTIMETAIPGVWLVSHYNQEEELMAKSIEITSIPSILPSDTEAMREGLTTIATLLEQ
jgi:hydrogenase-1 operon protein HyaF